MQMESVLILSRFKKFYRAPIIIILQKTLLQYDPPTNKSTRSFYLHLLHGGYAKVHYPKATTGSY